MKRFDPVAWLVSRSLNPVNHINHKGLLIIRVENKFQSILQLFNLQATNPQKYLFLKQQLSVKVFHKETV